MAKSDTRLAISLAKQFAIDASRVIGADCPALGGSSIDEETRRLDLHKHVGKARLHQFRSETLS